MANPLKTFATRLKATALGDRMVRRCPPLYQSFRTTLSKFEDADLKGRRALQARLIEQTLRAAIDRPGYAALNASGLADVPYLDKETLRAGGGNAFARSGFLTTRAQTSGSSGIPLDLTRSFASVVFEQAALDHIVALAGGDFAGDRVAVLRGDMIKPVEDDTPPFWHFENDGRILKASSAHLNLKTLPLYRDALAAFAPGTLWAYPSALELLVSALEELGLQLEIPIVLTSSEVLTQDLRLRAMRCLGATVVDYYGQAERVCLAYDIDGAGYRFLAPYGHVELRETDKPTNREIIATNLQNKAMILLRYTTGDIAVLEDVPTAAEAEELTLGLKPFSRIDGRESDYLLAPDGGRIIGMNHVPRGLTGVLQMQLHQKSVTDVIVYAVAAPSVLGDEAVKSAIAAAMKPRLHKDMTLSVELCEKLTRTKAGKLPFIIRETGISDD